MYKRKFKNKFFKKDPILQPLNGVLPICKLLFPNGSYCNGICRALWAVGRQHSCNSTTAKLLHHAKPTKRKSSFNSRLALLYSRSIFSLTSNIPPNGYYCSVLSTFHPKSYSFFLPFYCSL